MNQIIMTVFNCGEIRRISLFIFDRIICSNGFNHVFYDIYISSSTCKMKRNFSFCLFSVIQQLLERIILREKWCAFLDNFLLKINEVQFQLRNLKSCNWINNFLIELRYLLKLFHLSLFHQQYNYSSSYKRITFHTLFQYLEGEKYIQLFFILNEKLI